MKSGTFLLVIGRTFDQESEFVLGLVRKTLQKHQYSGLKALNVAYEGNMDLVTRLGATRIPAVFAVANPGLLSTEFGDRFESEAFESFIENTLLRKAWNYSPVAYRDALAEASDIAVAMLCFRRGSNPVVDPANMASVLPESRFILVEEERHCKGLGLPPQGVTLRWASLREVRLVSTDRAEIFRFIVERSLNFGARVSPRLMRFVAAGRLPVLVSFGYPPTGPQSFALESLRVHRPRLRLAVLENKLMSPEELRVEGLFPPDNSMIFGLFYSERSANRFVVRQFDLVRGLGKMTEEFLAGTLKPTRLEEPISIDESKTKALNLSGLLAQLSSPQGESVVLFFDNSAASGPLPKFFSDLENSLDRDLAPPTFSTFNFDNNDLHFAKLRPSIAVFGLDSPDWPVLFHGPFEEEAVVVFLTRTLNRNIFKKS